MNKLVELLVDTNALMTLDFEQYMDMLADVYRKCPRKREKIIEGLKRMSEYGNIKVGDAMRFAMRIVVERLEDKHVKQMIKYQDEDGKNRILISDPFVTIVTSFYENFCPPPAIALIKASFFSP